MPWAKFSDNAATHPRVMALTGLGDERVPNEVFGFVGRCATQSAAHMTDYVVDLGTARMFGFSRTEELLKLACRAGLMEKVRGGRQPLWKIVEDPELLHIRSRAEIEWERQRGRDSSNAHLTMPVKRRDGDGCRYCGVVVNWQARRGNRAGTYDHREPGKPATVETYVVCCAWCNKQRGNDPKADERLPLRPEPERPFYSAQTAQQLTEFFGTPFVATAEARPGTTPDTAPRATPQQAGHRAPRDPATGGTPRTQQAPSATPPPAEPRALRSADPPEPQVSAPGRDGTGPGSVTSTGATPPPADPAPPPTGPGRRRARRGRRRPRGDA